MAKRIQGMVIGFIVSALLFGGTAIALTGSRDISISYRDIKMYVDGVEFIYRDTSGNVIEPFIYNGTTYLPLRAVSGALGVDVEWEGSTSSIYLGKRTAGSPDNYLDRIQYSSLKVGYTGNKYYQISGAVTDYSGNSYSSGIVLFDYWSSRRVDKDTDNANIVVDYPLNGQYRLLNGKIVLPRNINITGLTENSVNNNANIDVLFYGDGRMLYTASNITTSAPHSFSVDLNGVNSLTIKVVNRSSSSAGTYAALTDLALYK